MARHFVEEPFEVLQSRLLQHYGVRARSRFVELKEPRLRTHLLEVGGGEEPMVIVHGGDGEAVNWAPLMAVLQDRFHLLAVDRPGFGLTEPFDYRGVAFRPHASAFMSSLLDALDLPSATLIGGSFGAFFCLVAALEHPERVRRLVLVGAPVGVARSASLPLRTLGGIPGAARLLMSRAATLEGQRTQYAREFHIDPDTVPELYFRTRMAGVRRPGAQKTFAHALRRVVGLRGFKGDIYLGDELPRLHQPTLFVWGEHDDLAPIAEAREVSEMMPDSTFVVLDGVGHFPFLEAPERTGELIARFVEQHPALEV
jgi:pimeloyl-ACP methyl ester carboxylesterase